jgi:hypothetical protein
MAKVDYSCFSDYAIVFRILADIEAASDEPRRDYQHKYPDWQMMNVRLIAALPPQHVTIAMALFSQLYSARPKPVTNLLLYEAEPIKMEFYYRYAAIRTTLADEAFPSHRARLANIVRLVAAGIVKYRTRFDDLLMYRYIYAYDPTHVDPPECVAAYYPPLVSYSLADLAVWADALSRSGNRTE